MTTHPTADELLESVKLFIERISPALEDRDAFLARVAVNALATVRREIAQGPAAAAASRARLEALLGETGDDASLTAALCDRIRDGVIPDDDPALLAHLRLSAVDQIEIDQPGYSGLAAFRAGIRAPDGSGREPLK